MARRVNDAYAKLMSEFQIIVCGDQTSTRWGTRTFRLECGIQKNLHEIQKCATDERTFHKAN